MAVKSVGEEKEEATAVMRAVEVMAGVVMAVATVGGVAARGE